MLTIIRNTLYRARRGSVAVLVPALAATGLAACLSGCTVITGGDDAPPALDEAITTSLGDEIRVRSHRGNVAADHILACLEVEGGAHTYAVGLTGLSAKLQTAADSAPDCGVIAPGEVTARFMTRLSGIVNIYVGSTDLSLADYAGHSITFTWIAE